jgi:hypothetical protein
MLKSITKARKKNKTRKKEIFKFRAHAAQAPALRVPVFVFSWSCLRFISTN